MGVEYREKERMCEGKVERGVSRIVKRRVWFLEGRLVVWYFMGRCFFLRWW